MSWSFGCFGFISAKPSTVPFLFIGQVVFLIVVTHDTAKHTGLSSKDQWSVFGLLILLAAWAILSSFLAVTNAYQASGALKWYPGVWMPLVPWLLIAIFFAASADLRSTLIAVADHVDQKWFVMIQGFRAAAVGSFVKAFRRSFPRTFGFTVGGLDMLYGISAWILFIALCTGSAVSTAGLFTWHLLGIFIIFPAAPIIIQLSLPGLVFSNESTPPMSELFHFPMVLAVSVVVPIFLALNALIVWRLGMEL